VNISEKCLPKVLALSTSEKACEPSSFLNGKLENLIFNFYHVFGSFGGNRLGNLGTRIYV